MPLTFVLKTSVARLALLWILAVASLLATGQSGATTLRLQPAGNDSGQHSSDAELESELCGAEEVGYASRGPSVERRAHRRASTAAERALEARSRVALVADLRRVHVHSPRYVPPVRPPLIRLLI